MTVISNNTPIDRVKTIQESIQKYLEKTDRRAIITGLLSLFLVIPGVVYYMWTCSQDKKNLEELKGTINSIPLSENGVVNNEVKKAHAAAIKTLGDWGCDASGLQSTESKVQQEQQTHRLNANLSYMANHLDKSEAIKIVTAPPKDLKDLKQVIKEDYRPDNISISTINLLRKDYSAEDINTHLNKKDEQTKSLNDEINAIPDIKDLDPLIAPKKFEAKVKELSLKYDLINNIEFLLNFKIAYGVLPDTSNVKIALINTPPSRNSQTGTNSPYRTTLTP